MPSDTQALTVFSLAQMLRHSVGMSIHGGVKSSVLGMMPRPNDPLAFREITRHAEQRQR